MELSNPRSLSIAILRVLRLFVIFICLGQRRISEDARLSRVYLQRLQPLASLSALEEPDVATGIIPVSERDEIVHSKREHKNDVPVAESLRCLRRRFRCLRRGSFAQTLSRCFWPGWRERQLPPKPSAQVNYHVICVSEEHYLQYVIAINIVGYWWVMQVIRLG
jgi:hypothetical protein